MRGAIGVGRAGSWLAMAQDSPKLGVGRGRALSFDLQAVMMKKKMKAIK